jgi:tetratricopeptide (TPR) repeat protein
LIFFPKGNKELGLQQLVDCSLNAKFAKTEAKYVLCYVNLVFEKNYTQSLRYALELDSLYPQNPVFEKFLGRSYVGLSRFGESVNIWLDVMTKADSNKFGYNTKYARQEANYYLAVSYLNLGRNDEAEKCYNESLKLSNELDKDKESAYKVFSTLGLGMLQDRKGNRNEAIKYYNQVLEMKEYDNSKQLADFYKNNAFR